MKKKDYEIQEYGGDVFDFYADEFGTHSHWEEAFWPAQDEGLQAIYSQEGRKESSRTYRTGKAMMRFLDTQPKDKPFSLSVSFYAVKHGHFNPADVAKFKDRDFSVPENWVEGPNKKLIAQNKSYRTHGVRTDRWKYFVYYEHNPVIEELYDMSQDPLEQNNLVNDPEHAKVLEELRQKNKLVHRKAAG